MQITTGGIKYYSNHPVEFVEDIIGATPDRYQREVLQGIESQKMVTVRSGHGVGKSTIEAWTLLWYIFTRPYPKIPCTAPTQHQLYDILWAEVAKWMRNSRTLSDNLVWTKEKVYMKGAPEEWFAVPRTATKPDALQGFHADNVLYIIDEASGVKDDIFEPVLGSLSTEGAKLLMCGNPTQLSGFFYDSHNKNRASYTAFHIDSRKSQFASQDFIKTIADMYGEDSDVFRVRVAGDFPQAGEDVFIPLPLVERSIQTEYKAKARPDSIHIGVDVARFGDDRTVIGYKVDERAYIKKKINGQDTMRTADDVAMLGLELVEKYGLKAETDDMIPIKIDDGGVGGGVVDRLRQMQRNEPERYWWMDITPVNFGQRIKHKYYYDTTTYMMSIVKRLLQPYDENGLPKPVELILPDDADMVAQLSGRKYSLMENGRVKVESKKEMKKRERPSPDEADCILLLCLPVKPRKSEKAKKEKRKGVRGLV